MAETVLVIGGTGDIGSEAVALFAQDASKPLIRIATRDPTARQAQYLQSLAPERVSFVSIASKDDIEKAVAGCSKVFLITTFEKMIEIHEMVATASKAAGVSFIFKVSVIGARIPQEGEEISFVPKLHGQAEQVLEKSGVPFFSCQPTMFAKHLTSLNPVVYQRGNSELFFPIGDARVSIVDYRDVALLGVRVLLDPQCGTKYNNIRLPLTGPTAVSAQEVGNIMSFVGGQTITVHSDVEAFEARAKQLNMAPLLAGIYGEGRGGHFAAILGQEKFAEICGRYPTHIGKFLSDNRAFYMP